MPPKSGVLCLECPASWWQFCRKMIMRISWFFSVLLLLSLHSFGQGPVPVMAGRYQFVSALLRQQEDVFSMARHPASVAVPGRWLLGLGTERPIVQDAGGVTTWAAVRATEQGQFSWLVDHRAAGSLRETQAGFGYSLPLSGVLRMGVRLNFYRLRIAGYGAHLALPVEWGGSYRITDRLITSVHIYNLFSRLTRPEKFNVLPRVIRIGAGYSFSARTALGFEIAREEGRPVRFQPVLSLQPVDRLYIRTGYASDTRGFFLSTGYRTGRFRVDLAFQQQALTGLVAGLSCQLSNAQKEE